MCKYNNRLFSIIILLQIISNVKSASLSSLLLDADADDVLDKEDYDIYYDQRQNGTENLRIHIDGVVIGLGGGGGGGGGFGGGAGGSSSSPVNILGGAALGLLDGLAETDTDDGADDFFLFKNVNGTNSGEQVKATKPADSPADTAINSDDSEFDKDSTGAVQKEKKTGTDKRFKYNLGNLLRPMLRRTLHYQ